MIRLNKKKDINKRIFYANSHVGIVDNFFYVTRVNLSCRKLRKMLTKSEAEKSPHIYQRAEVLFKEIRRRPRGRLLSMTPSGFVQMAKGHANVINLNMIYVPSFKVLNINWNPNKLAWESRSTGLCYNWGKIQDRDTESNASRRKLTSTCEIWLTDSITLAITHPCH